MGTKGDSWWGERARGVVCLTHRSWREHRLTHTNSQLWGLRKRVIKSNAEESLCMQAGRICTVRLKGFGHVKLETNMKKQSIGLNRTGCICVSLCVRSRDTVYCICLMVVNTVVYNPSQFFLPCVSFSEGKCNVMTKAQRG